MKKLVVSAILIMVLFYGMVGGQTLVTPKQPSDITNGSIEGPLEITGASSYITFDNGITIDGDTADNLTITGSGASDTFDLALPEFHIQLDETVLDNSTGTPVLVSGVIYKGGNSFLHDSSVANTTGGNVFLGNMSGSTEIQRGAGSWTASGNLGIGSLAIGSLTSGYSNLGIGSSSLNGVTTGYDNTGVGSSSLQNATTGYENIAIGTTAGVNFSTGPNPLLTPNKSIFIGNETRALVDAGTNEIVIGYATTGKGSNTVVIGNASNTANYFTGLMSVDGVDGLSATYTFGGGASGEVLTMTFTGGILTGATLVP